MRTRRMTPDTTDLAVRAAQQSGLCLAHGDLRQANAFERAARLLLAHHSPARQTDGSYVVMSASHPTTHYTVRPVGGVLVCDCPAGHWSRACKHVALVETIQAN